MMEFPRCVLFICFLEMVCTATSKLERKQRLDCGTDNCLKTELGGMYGIAFPEQILLQIKNIVPLSCVCKSIGNEGNVTWVETASGVRGSMAPLDCGALRFFAKVSAAVDKL